MNPVKRTGPNDCAFPLHGVFGGTGITAREWFAGLALIGILGSRPQFCMPAPAQLAEAAYEYADALLAPANKKKEVDP